VIELAPGAVLGAFRLVRKLGAGAFAEVWLAREEGELGFQRRVALKVLKEGANEGDAHFANLVNEARVCGHLHHPHIVSVQGVSRADGMWFIAMEYVDGATLEDLIDAVHTSRLTLPRSIILDIGIQVAEALEYAHEARDGDGRALNIIHRDLKPANIMIARRGGVKVADFGIAKATTNIDSTATGTLKGTPAYVAPEVWRGSRNFTPGVDLFALGAILWELVTQRRLLDGDSMAAMAGQAALGDPDQEVAPLGHSFPELQPVVRRLLDRDPTQRTQSGGELAEALRRIRRNVEAPGDLDLFLELLELARTEKLKRAPSSRIRDLPETDEPGWSQVIAVVSGSHPTLQSGRALRMPDTAPVLHAGSGGPVAEPASTKAQVSTAATQAPLVFEPVEETREQAVEVKGTQSMQMGPAPRGSALPWIAGAAGTALLVAGVLVFWAMGPAPAPVERTEEPPALEPDPFDELMASGDSRLDATTPAQVGPPIPKPRPPSQTDARPSAAPKRPPPGPVPGVEEPTPETAPAEPTPLSESTPAVEEPTPEPVPVATVGCIAFMSVPPGAAVTLDGSATSLRARSRPTLFRSFRPRSVRVGMGSSDSVDASVEVSVRAGEATGIRCVLTDGQCSVQALRGVPCP